MKAFILLALCAALLSGCTMPLRPGQSSFRHGPNVEGFVRQSENPQQETTQIYKRIEEPATPSATPAPRVTEVFETKIGAAQKDTAREIGAKLASLRPVMLVGILVFLFGAASFVWPPLKAVVGGSVTTSAVISVAGVAMIVLPTLIVGNELAILGVGLGAAVLYWFSHRHGKLQGLVDANKNGIDDREEGGDK